MSGAGGKWIRPRDEVRSELDEQIQALNASCKAFDDGATWEAKRIATAAYMIAFDGPAKSQSRSILGRLGLSTGCNFLSSAKIDSPGNRAAAWNLISLTLSSAGAAYAPLLDFALVHHSIRPLTLQEWWNEPVLRKQRTPGEPDQTLSRGALIKSMRDQDGGAHYDGELRDEVYADFVRRNAVGFSEVVMHVEKQEDITPSDSPLGWRVAEYTGSLVKESPMKVGPQFATMRQIGWELVLTLDNMLFEFPK